MKVAELIAVLERLDPQAEVLVPQADAHTVAHGPWGPVLEARDSHLAGAEVADVLLVGSDDYDPEEMSRALHEAAGLLKPGQTLGEMLGDES